MAAKPPEFKTEVVTNFSAKLSRYNNGELDSGFAKFLTTAYVDSFRYPGNLSWMETPIQIDSGGTIITDLIVAGKERVENGISYVYAIGHLGRLYKIQVNNPSTDNPNYDTPVLLTTLTNGQTFTFGGSMEFFGASGNTYIWIGHDAGVTRIDFAGTNETVIGTTDSTHWIANVPRQVIVFIGSLFYTNGTNIAQIDSTLTVVSYTKLSPGFPINTNARDIRQTADGRYIVVVVTEAPLNSILALTQDTNNLSSAKSYLIYWNGTDVAASSSTIIPSYITNSYFTFAALEFFFGSDSRGGNLSNPQQKILSLPQMLSPLPNSIYSNGNMIDWIVPFYNNGFLKGQIISYGQYDAEFEPAYYRRMMMPANGTSTDVVQTPFMLPVSNYSFGASYNAYTGNVIGTGKIYFSTLENNGTTQKFRFYSFLNVPYGTGTAAGGVYETQTQIFGEKRQIKELRFYIEPLVANNSFQIDLIGSDGNVITDSLGVRQFTVGNPNAVVGQDMLKYNPQVAPTYCLGVRITNLGTKNFVMHKMEIDHCSGGD